MIPARKSQNWLPGIFNDFFGNEWVEKSGKTAPAVNIFEIRHGVQGGICRTGPHEGRLQHPCPQRQRDGDLDGKEAGAHREGQERGTCLRREFSYNQFQQSMILPENAEMDKIEARVKNGVLTIQIPKKAVKENAETSRKVEVY